MSNPSILCDSSTINTITSSDLQQSYVDYQHSSQIAEQQHQQLISNALASLSKAQTLLHSLESRESHRKAILLKLHCMVQKWQKSWEEKLEEEKKFFDLAQKAILSDITDAAEQDIIAHDDAVHVDTENSQLQLVHNRAQQPKHDDGTGFSDTRGIGRPKTKLRDAEEGQTG